MRNEQTPYSLEQALPTQVVAHRHLLFLGYRRFPVFSHPWLLRRTLLFSAVLAMYAAMAMLGDTFSGTHLRESLLSGLVFFIGFFVIFTIGPLLATLVRHARMPLRRERIAVVLAVLIGMFASFFADTWTSGYLERNDPPAQRDKKLINRPELSEAQKAGVLTFNLMLLAAIYGAFGGGLALRAYFGELRRWQNHRDAETMADVQAQKQQADLRLSVLQAQVEPHFLFNTLASVRALVRQSPERAEATLDALVDYLRATIPRFRDDEAALHSTLGQQLEMCVSYLELMRLRTDGRLNYRVMVEPVLRECAFPPMLLITLIENAIKHGIEPKPGAGHVEIAAVRDAQGLHVRVSDDGLGLQPGIGAGLGLANVRAQLQTRYTGRARLDLRSASGGGTIAELHLPPDDAEDASHGRGLGEQAQAVV
jgi:hypothetical protein